MEANLATKSSRKTHKHNTPSVSSPDPIDPPKKRSNSLFHRFRKFFTNSETSHKRHQYSPPRQRAASVLGLSYQSAVTPTKNTSSENHRVSRRSTVSSVRTNYSTRTRAKTVVESKDAEAQQPRSVLQFALM